MTDQKKTMGISELIEAVADQGVKIAKLEQTLTNLGQSVQNMHSHLTFISQVVKYTVQDTLEYSTEYKIGAQPTQANYIRAQWKSDPETMAMTLEGEEYVNGESAGSINAAELNNQLKMEIIKCAIQFQIPAGTDFYLTRQLVPVDPHAAVETQQAVEEYHANAAELDEVLDDAPLAEDVIPATTDEIEEAVVVPIDTPEVDEQSEVQSC